MFLMRMLFTMFAEDVALLPRDCFKQLLKDCAEKPEIFPSHDGGSLAGDGRRRLHRHDPRKRSSASTASSSRGAGRWRSHGKRSASSPPLPTTTGRMWSRRSSAPFSNRRSTRPIAEGSARITRRAPMSSGCDRHRHRPLRAEWDHARSTADRLKSDARARPPSAPCRPFTIGSAKSACSIRPAATGNFLYVALELLKRLEGEVLEAINDLGGQEALSLDSHTVDPHQFLGLEINPRAAAIAELVLWIGHLQWHYRNRGVAPSEPILKPSAPSRPAMRC